MSCTKTTLAADRFVGLRKELPFDYLLNCKTEKDSEATAYSYLISTVPSRCNNFIKKTPQGSSVSLKRRLRLDITQLAPRVMNYGVKILHADTILGAPGASNDFYSNLLDVSKQGDLLIGI